MTGIPLHSTSPNTLNPSCTRVVDMITLQRDLGMGRASEISIRTIHYNWQEDEMRLLSLLLVPRKILAWVWDGRRGTGTKHLAPCITQIDLEIYLDTETKRFDFPVAAVVMDATHERHFPDH